MKLYRSVAGSRPLISGRLTVVQGADSIGTPLHMSVESSWQRLQTGFLRHEFLAAMVLVIAASIIVIVPMLVLGMVSGRDFPFHLASWMDVAKQWREGMIYPQWAESANWGFGEPRFVFYPPGSWVLGAALGSLLPWKAVPIVFVWVVLIAAGLSMFLLARESMPRQQAALAAMFYVANPYHLLLIYYRCAFAELLASAFFPLLPWGVMRIARRGWRAVPVLALAVALIWLSNAPAAVIAVYSVVFLCFVVYAVRRELLPLMYGAMGLAGGFGLAAFYILPAAHQRAWVQIKEALADGFRPEQNFLFSRATSVAVNSDFNLKISCVVLLMGLLIAVAAVHFAKSVEIPRLPYWVLLALGAMSFFMMFPLSRPLWELAPELCFVQFPWRYAVPFAVAFTFFLGGVAGKFKSFAMAAVCLFVFAGPVAKILLAVARPSSWKKAEIAQLQASIDAGRGYRGTPEYLPIGASAKAAEDVEIQTRTASKVPNEFATKDKGDRKTFCVQFREPREIALNLFDYPTWQVDVDGSRIDLKRTDSLGRIVADVPEGNHSIHVFLQRSWDAKLGIAISIATGVLLSYLSFMTWRQNVRSSQRESNFECSVGTATVQAPTASIRGDEPG